MCLPLPPTGMSPGEWKAQEKKELTPKIKKKKGI